MRTNTWRLNLNQHSDNTIQNSNSHCKFQTTQSLKTTQSFPEYFLLFRNRAFELKETSLKKESVGLMVGWLVVWLVYNQSRSLTEPGMGL